MFSSFVATIAALNFAVAASALNCDESYECWSQIIYDETNISGSGYKSISRCIIDFSNSVQYLGSFSGFDSLQITTRESITSQGTASCFQSNTVTSNGPITCQATNDCCKTTLKSSNNTIYCNGDQSCSQSEIYGTSLIIANGAYSLYNSKISSEDLTNDDTTTKMKIEFLGYYSGYNTSISCESDVICEIMCAGDNSCVNLRLDCPSDNCIILCNYSIYDTEEVYDSDDDTNSCLNNSYSMIDTLGLIVDTELMVSDADSICDGSDSISYDDGIDGVNNITDTIILINETNLGNGNLCFRGGGVPVSNGRNVIIKHQLSQNETTMVCSGANSCAQYNVIVYDNKTSVGCTGML